MGEQKSDCGGGDGGDCGGGSPTAPMENFKAQINPLYPNASQLKSGMLH